MDKRVILAIAGAGKTYTLCKNIDKEKRNLVIAFTRQNIANINKELNKQFGEIPYYTQVMTFHSFVYRFFIAPYEPTIIDFFGIEKFKNEGITFLEPPVHMKMVRGKRVYNNKYKCKNEFEHYVYDRKYYCSLMSELLLYVNGRKTKLISRSSKNLMKFFDNLYIDEFQDFRGFEYEFLIKMSKYVNKILMVGDYYQHSVSGKNNTGKPFNIGKKHITYDEYIKLLEKEKFTIDEKSLSTSRRCTIDVCNFISQKLGIQITSGNKREGKVFFLNMNNAKEILDNDKIKKLIYSESDKYKFNSINWGYSKGDTYSEVCVILTATYEELELDTFCGTRSLVTDNKLYVALSRTEGDLYILKKSIFDCIRNSYIK